MSHQKRSIHGILLLDKPSGITSNAALQTVKRLFNARKAGHTGSLDPLANGMLPLCFGDATKFSQYLLESDKVYQVSAKLGVRTETGDAEGEVIASRTVPALTFKSINKAFDQFRGTIDQVPSMYSALKYKGTPLYKFAREGITVERKSRAVTIYELTLLDFNDDTIHFELRCSKGTYVRTLVDDFGELLGCGAHVIGLRRLSVGPYQTHSMVSMEALEETLQSADHAALDHYLLPIDTTVKQWPEVRLTKDMAFYLKRGQAVVVPFAPVSGWVRIALKDGTFLGVGEMLDGGKVAPRKLMSGKK